MLMSAEVQKSWIGLKAFIKCSNSMDDVYEDINEYNPGRKKRRICVWSYDCRYYN